MVRWLKTGGDGIHRQLKKRLKHLEREILNVQTYLKQFEEGDLICAKNGKHFKWYHTDGTNQTYIPKDQRKFAEQLAIKKYYTMILNDMENEKEACFAYLKKRKEEQGTRLLTRPGYDELLKPYFEPLSEALFRWANEPYEKNLNHPENLVHKCTTGLMVRSKSESMIASYLSTKKIPFRYECALYLNGVLVFPDFTIRHPKTGEVYYWEHFGLMDQPSYVKRTMEKMQNYTLNGIIPSIHLITTYETKDHPLSTMEVEEIVEKYFG